jgi:hypothetical protein
MGFNKRYLPPIDDLAKIRHSYPRDNEFLRCYFFKVDAFIGPKESIDYLIMVNEEEKERRDDSRKDI